MKVQELLKMYKNNPRIDIAKQLDVKKYTSIAYKREMAKLVLSNSISIVDGEVHIDSVERYILFTIAVIGMHTNLEFSYEDDNERTSIDDYDELCESGLLVKIINTFQEDYVACQEVLNMMTSDIMQDNLTIEKKIYKFLDYIQDILSDAINGVVEKLDTNLLNDLQLDKDDLHKIYDAIRNK